MFPLLYDMLHQIINGIIALRFGYAFPNSFLYAACFFKAQTIIWSNREQICCLGVIRVISRREREGVRRRKETTHKPNYLS